VIELKKLKRLTLICLPLFLAACESIPNKAPDEENTSGGRIQNKETNQIITQQPQQKAPEVDEAVKVSPAVTSLLDRAAQQEKEGNQSAAIGSIERAIRIAPRYPESYYRLGELRYKQGNYSQARSMGQKSLSLGASGWLRNQSLKLIDNASK
jgi:tetratricopeptide (TPR) repeat protein